MTEIKKHLDLYEASKAIYIEGNLFLLLWVECAFGDRKSSNLASHTFLLVFTKVLVKLYPKALRESLRYVQEAIRIQHNDYNYLLLESVVLYSTGKINSAICSFRRAFNLKNKIRDPFYKSKRKEERYETEIATINLQEIASILEPGILKSEINKNNKQKALSIEQLIDKFNSCQNLEEKISVLEKIKRANTRNEKSKQGEVYDFILKHIESLLDTEDKAQYKLYYMQGESSLKLALLEDNLVDDRKIFEVYSIYTRGLKVFTNESEKVEEKLNKYRELIIDLIGKIDNYSAGNLDKKLTSARNNVGITAAREINELIHEQATIEEIKHLCRGDIYTKLGMDLEAITSYLKALESWKQKDSLDFWKDMKKTKKHRKKWRKVSNEKLAELFNDKGRNGIKILLKEVDKSLSEYYSLLWRKVGQGLSDLQKKSKSYQGHYQAIEAYTEALEYADEVMDEIEIRLLRSKVYLRIGDIAKANKDLTRVLDIDKCCFVSHEPTLNVPKYRNLLRALANTYFKKAYRNNISSGRIFTLENLFDIERDYYENLKRSFEATHYSDEHRKARINKCCRRISELHYIEGLFICEKNQYLELNPSFERQRSNLKTYIDQSVRAYKKALEEIRGVTKSGVTDYHVDYFMLEIMTGLVKAGFNFPEKYYEDIQECLQRGSQILRSLQKAEEDRANATPNSSRTPLLPRFITKEKFHKNFEVIESFAISHIKGDKTAIEHAEARKNICLTRLLPKGEVTENREFSYERVGDILNLNTVIVYWYIGITEITLFILSKNQGTSVSIIKETLNYKKYIEYKQSIEAWEAFIGSVGRSPSADLLEGMENCLSDFYASLGIQKIIDTLHKNKCIENVILIPHRDLHKIPLHVFFCSFYRKEEHPKENYNLTYLPSIELGLHLDSNFIANPELLIVHPFETNNHDLLNSYAESAGVYLRFCKSSSRVPKKLEGDPDARKATVSQELQDNIRFNYFHFLGHARHDFNQPEQSALNLTGNNHLTWGHILRELDFSSYHLVCLSACETGVTSTTRLLSEYVGLVSAFLETGASYVISSLWKIEDISASLLMIEFYRLISTHEHPVRALQKAQHWLRTSSKNALSKWCRLQALELREIIDQLPNPKHEKLKLKASVELIDDYSYVFLESSQPFPFEHPYYWAGFVITGLPPQTESG